MKSNKMLMKQNNEGFTLVNMLIVIAVIGIVLLIGIVKKNGIMIVDFALSAQRGEALSPREAVFKASSSSAISLSICSLVNMGDLQKEC